MQRVMVQILLLAVTIAVFLGVAHYAPLPVAMLVTAAFLVVGFLAPVGVSMLSGIRASGPQFFGQEEDPGMPPLPENQSEDRESEVAAATEVNPAPSAMSWLNLPASGASVVSVLSELAAHSALMGLVPVWAASRAGSRHMAKGELRQDAFALMPVGRGAVGAVADGLGSTQGAHAVANAAVMAATEVEWAVPVASESSALDVEWHRRSERLVEAVQKGLESQLQGSTISTTDGKTTLAIARVEPESDDFALVYWLSVGDSAVLHFSPSTNDFEFMNTAPLDMQDGTEAIPDPNPTVETGVFRLPKNNSCVLATDGAWKQIYADYEHFSANFQQLITRRADASHLLAIIEAESSGFDDDATIVIMNYPGTGEVNVT